MPNLGMRGAIPPLTHMPSRSAQKLYIASYLAGTL